MSLKPQNYGKTFSELLVVKKYDKNYDVDQIDSLKSFSYSGMNYENRLIFAIKEVNFEEVKKLLMNGSSPRGYDKFPGYPLLTVIETINNDLCYKNNINILMLIIELLVNYGARFDDYIVHIYWKKYDYLYEHLDEINRNVLLNLYKRSPFKVSKYKLYLNIYIKSYPVTDKKKLIKEFNKKYKKNNFVIKYYFF